MCSPSEAMVGGNHKKVILWKFYIADIEGREEQMLNWRPFLSLNSFPELSK